MIVKEYFWVRWEIKTSKYNWPKDQLNLLVINAHGIQPDSKIHLELLKANLLIKESYLEDSILIKRNVFRIKTKYLKILLKNL